LTFSCGLVCTGTLNLYQSVQSVKHESARGERDLTSEEFQSAS
jgi:hypothetical protein